MSGFHVCVKFCGRCLSVWDLDVPSSSGRGAVMPEPLALRRSSVSLCICATLSFPTHQLMDAPVDSISQLLGILLQWTWEGRCLFEPISPWFCVYCWNCWIIVLVLVFWETSTLFFMKAVPILYSQLQSMFFSPVSIPSPAFFCVFDNSHIKIMKWYPIVALNYIFLVLNDAEYFVTYRLLTSMYSFEKCLYLPLCKHVHVCSVHIPVRSIGKDDSWGHQEPCFVYSPWDGISLRQGLHFKQCCFTIIFCYHVFKFLMNSRYWPLKRCKGKHKRFGWANMLVWFNTVNSI